MHNLFAALMTKMAGSTLSTAVGGRIYLDQAPEETAFPYIVFFIVWATPSNTFAEKKDDVGIQFSLFSQSKGATEITGMYTKLKALFDDSTFALTGGTLLSMERTALATVVEDTTTSSGDVGVKHWAVDYLGRIHYA